ncbi:MAG: glycerol kinase GlpK [SAR324 cluster bacterium]|nr:glycerol kinase GlpK [SAR324 cluster bacterium]
MKNLFLAIDQGTTGTTCILFDEQWHLLGHGYLEHTQFFPRLGWVEHDPIEIWNNVLKSVSLALQSGGLNAQNIRAIGVDNQGETCLVWDRSSGLPVYNAIVWQDRRTAEAATKLRSECGEMIHQSTGLHVDAYFSALKILWILDHIQNGWQRFYNKELLVGTLDTWIIWKLTQGESYVTDPSTASRTMLYDLFKGCWDEVLTEKMQLFSSFLPRIQETASIFGYTSKNSFFGVEVPISASVVDQAAALFGQTCFELGSIKTTYGTGCFTLMNIGQQPQLSKNGLLTTAVWDLGGRVSYALDGGVYIAGAAVQWLRDGLRIIRNAQETEWIAESVEDCGGVYFVPAFVGLAAPYWDQYARGTIVGLTGGATYAHIVRATLESIAFQVADNLEVMKTDSGIEFDVMRADGGAVQNKFLMQFQADILGIPVEVPEIHETTALGSAFLAAIGIGAVTDTKTLEENWKLSRRYEPTISSDERFEKISQWKRAVERSREWDLNRNS